MSVKTSDISTPRQEALPTSTPCTNLPGRQRRSRLACQTCYRSGQRSGHGCGIHAGEPLPLPSSAPPSASRRQAVLCRLRFDGLTPEHAVTFADIEGLAILGESGAHLAGVRPGAHLLVGGTMESDEKIPREVVADVTAVGTSQTRTALPLLRELAEAGRLRHDGGVELAEQVAGLLVVPSPAGGLTVSTGRAVPTWHGGRLGGPGPHRGPRGAAGVLRLLDLSGVERQGRRSPGHRELAPRDLFVSRGPGITLKLPAWLVQKSMQRGGEEVREASAMRLFSSGRYAAVISTLALVVALSGASYLRSW